MKEGKVLKVGPGGAYKIVKEAGEEGGAKIVYYWTPKAEIAGEGQVVKVIKEGEAVEAAPEVFVKRIKEKKAGETWVVGEPVKEATAVKEVEGVKVVAGQAKVVSPTIVWTAKEPVKEGKEGAVWVTKKFSGRPVEGAWVGGGGKAFAFSSAADKDMLEKIHALQEQVAAIKAKKMDLSALEESLKKLEVELNGKEEKLNELKMKFEAAPAEVIGVSTGDNSIQIVLVGKGTGPEDYERAAVRLKKELPEGYKLLEQKFDAENGTMTFKISSPEGKKIDEQTVRKLVESLKEEPIKK